MLWDGLVGLHLHIVEYMARIPDLKKVYIIWRWQKMILPSRLIE